MGMSESAQTDAIPTSVLICHEEDRLDSLGLASWLANTQKLAGLIIIRNSRRTLWRAARREIKRVGFLKFLDVVAFRAYARVALARRDDAWKTQELARLRARYPADLESVPRVYVPTPNAPEARAFLEAIRPDVAIARCKFILKPEIFEAPRAGTFVFHPGVCPEYRNAHGCFWALANRDLDRVGMTLLRVDKGIDTGSVYLHATCAIDEIRESHNIIQARVVSENLETIGKTLRAIANGEDVPIVPTAGRRSAVWGQPRLIDYLRWKLAARRSRSNARRIPALP